MPEDPGYLPSLDLGDEFAPFRSFQSVLGFVPRLFRSQTLLPRAIEAESRIAETVLFTEHALSRRVKECLLLAVAAANRNTYCVTAHGRFLQRLGATDQLIHDVSTDFRQAELPPDEQALLAFALKLSRHPTWIGGDDVQLLRDAGHSDTAILETVLVTGLTQFLCTLSTGLGVKPDFEPRNSFPTGDTLDEWTRQARRAAAHSGDGAAPWLHTEPRDPESFTPFTNFRDWFGFVPNLFRAQTLRDDVLEAEALAVRNVLLTEDLLTRTQKESILLVISAANLNTYCVAVHCELLRGLGIPVESSDQIAVDHHQAGLSEADCALLDTTLKLATRQDEFEQADIDRLTQQGFTHEQAVEAVVMTALTSFLNTVQMGLAPHPDFPPPRQFSRERLPGDEPEPLATVKPPGPRPHPTTGAVSPSATSRGTKAPDEDGDFVARAQQGDLAAFEQLVQRHTPRVYRTVIGIVGREGDAEDAVQETFLKVFKSLNRFQGASRFSTWVTRIAINEGLQILRRRKPSESLDETGEDEGFQPRNVQAWSDDPERLCAREETRTLVRRAVAELPLAYRVVVTLQQIEGVPVAEIAEALEMSVGAVKTRAHRGRLMLRERLAPYFVA